jgi:protein-S-isoprenylcysteine O-methyltransferase Ste14
VKCRENSFLALSIGSPENALKRKSLFGQDAGTGRRTGSRVTAVILLVSGAVFGVSGVVALGGGRTIFPEPPPKARLVRSRIYAIVRHPLYASVILLSFAWALWWRSVPGLGLALVSFVFLDAKARSEEERLRARFLDYQGYARRVKRLVPWIY